MRFSILPFWLSYVGSLLILISIALPIQADQNDPELTQLFEQLHQLPTAYETHQIESKIWAIWITSNDQEVNQMMQAGIQAMQYRRYRQALKIFDKMVEIAPEFAEGWNKRATIHYMLQNYEASIADIERTLALEPRHFGAISGLGLVHLAMENYFEALEAYESVLKVHPALRGAKINIERIKAYLKKQTL